MENEKAIDQLFEDVKILEKRDSVMNSKVQLERLNRKGSKYFNLNPYEVFLLDPDATEAEIKRRYKELTILVHPDKNLKNVEEAKTSFEAVKYAYRTLTSPEGKKKCEEVLDESRLIVAKIIDEKRTKLRKQGAKSLDVEEDDPLKIYGELIDWSKFQ